MFGYGAQWGYTTDPETGLLLLTNRYYDPGTARFLTRDPLGQAGGLNLYGYCGNNPSSYADPLGLVSRDQYVANGEAFGGALGITVGTESTVVGGVVLATALGGYFGNVGGSLYDSGEDFGFAVGCYEGGQATLGQVVWSGFKGSVNVASNALFLAGIFAPAFAPQPMIGPPAPTDVAPSGAAKVDLPEETGPAVPAGDVTEEWDRFLGTGERTDVHPRTGARDNGRIVTQTGRYSWHSIRYGNHEMKYSHYHEETWEYDPATHTVTIRNVYRKIK